MSTLHTISVSLHMLAALFWIGGMLFLAVVGAPALRKLESPNLRARLFGEIGRRFRLWGWVAICVLLATGVANLHFWGLLDPAILGSGEFWRTPLGRSLAWKLVAVAAMVGASAAHDFWLGPAASRAPAGEGRAERMRRWAGWLARGNAVLGVVVVVLAVRLARGG